MSRALPSPAGTSVHSVQMREGAKRKDRSGGPEGRREDLERSTR